MRRKITNKKYCGIIKNINALIITVKKITRWKVFYYKLVQVFVELHLNKVDMMVENANILSLSPNIHH